MPSVAGGRAGRRPGRSETREEILEAARRLFADRGFDRATIRGIAQEAGVNPAMIHHFFGSKEQLFIAVLEFPFDPALVIPQVVGGDPAKMGERMVRAFLAVWADDKSRGPLLALVRSATTNEQAAGMMREFNTATIVKPVAETLDLPLIRVEAAVAQLIGVVILRYVMRLEPIASASEDELVELFAPTVQRYFEGPVAPR